MKKPQQLSVGDRLGMLAMLMDAEVIALVKQEISRASLRIGSADSTALLPPPPIAASVVEIIAGFLALLVIIRFFYPRTKITPTRFFFFRATLRTLFTPLFGLLYNVV